MDWVNQLSKINNKFKFQLFAKHAHNLEKAYAQIAQFDQQSSDALTIFSFNLYLNSFGVFFTTQELRSIRDAFPQGELVRYYDFIESVRQDITPKRMAVIDHAFDELAENDVVSVDTLLGRFRSEKHPHVRCLNKTGQKVNEEFVRSVKVRSGDGKHLNYSEFKQLFLDISACIPLEREEFFVDLVINSLQLNDDRVSLERIKQLEVTVYEKVRAKTYFKKDQGQKSQSAFRFIDLEDKGLVNFQRFVDVLDKLACKFTQKENRALFDKHSREQNLMSYEDLCGLLFEMGSGNKDNSNLIYEYAKNDGGYVTTPGMTKKLH